MSRWDRDAHDRLSVMKSCWVRHGEKVGACTELFLDGRELSRGEVCDQYGMDKLFRLIDIAVVDHVCRSLFKGMFFTRGGQKQS